MDKLTGPQLFLRYAFPCAEDKLHVGKISDDDFNQLKNVVENNLEPNGWLLEYCFTDASHDLKALAESLKRKAWSYENVADYWREKHGHEGDCAIIKAMICEVSDRGITVIHSNKTLVVQNIYKLDLQVGDVIYIHKRVAIEIEE